MTARIGALLVLMAVACGATARNVIHEWGLHDPNDYVIFTDPQTGDDVAVLIYANTQAWLAWKFEAYNAGLESQPPGYINSISIADGVTVADIRLSVIGQLPHLHGAAQLKSFDLSTNGTSTNKLEELDITGDFGELGPLWAPGAGTLTIGGLVRNAISVGDVTGPVTIGQLGADLACTGMRSLTIAGPTPQGYPLPNITVAGDYAAPYEMDISQAVNRLEIEKLYGDVVVSSLEHLKVYSIWEDGSVEVPGDLSHLELTDGLFGSVTTGGDLHRAEIGQISSTGLLDVGHNLGGGGDDNYLYISNVLAGTVRVRNDLLASTNPEEYNVAADIAEFQAPGKLQVDHDADDIHIGRDQAEALPAGTAVSVGLELNGAARGLWVWADVTSGTITFNDTETDLIVGIDGDLNGTLHSNNDLRYVQIDGAVLQNGSITAGEAIRHLSSGDMDGTIGASVISDKVKVGNLNGTLSADLIEAEINVTGSLNGTLSAGLITAEISIGGSLTGGIEAQNIIRDEEVGIVVVRNLTGYIHAADLMRIPIVVGLNFSGSISAGTMVTEIVVWEIMEPSASLTTTVGDMSFVFWAGTLGGTVSVARDLTGVLTSPEGVITGDITVGRDITSAGAITAGAISGTIAVGTDATPGNMSGSIAADILGGAITISGDLESTIEGTEMTADLWIKGNLSNCGAVLVSGLPDTCTPGTFRIDGNAAGTIDIPVLCDQAGDLSQGHIIVNGSFAEGGEIHLWGALTGTAFFACDYDGWDAGDDWSPNAVIIIDDPWGTHYYYANWPDRHLWHTTWVRGDMDNNSPPDAVFPDFTDINPFILALSDPPSYALTYPGLAEVDPNNPTTYTGASVIYHGDCNCDMVFDFADINAFINLLNGQPDPNCPDYPEGDGGGGEQRTPEELAKLLADNVAPELYDGLVYVVGQAIDAQPDDESRAYWEAVYAALTE